MICPHCTKTIEEQHRYAMSRDPEQEMVWTSQARFIAGLILCFVIAIGIFQLLPPAS